MWGSSRFERRAPSGSLPRWCLRTSTLWTEFAGAVRDFWDGASPYWWCPTTSLGVGGLLATWAGYITIDTVWNGSRLPIHALDSFAFIRPPGTDGKTVDSITHAVEHRPAPMVDDTVCYACGRRYGPERKRCDCGEPVWFDIDPTGFDWPTRPDRGMWAYADLLPADPPTDLGAAAGGTPLFRTPRLDEWAGCRLFVKDETENPTGTFKDRGSAVAVAAARDRGRSWIGTVSHGNMAMSTAAHAAAAGLDCVVFVPDDISDARLAAIGQYGPEVVRVRGDYGRLYHETLSADVPDIEFVNSDTPLRVAGQSTVALEICERFAPETPDAIVLPVSSGGQASGVGHALRLLHDAGLIDDLPALHLVQAAGCDPIARAFRNGDSAVAPIEPEPTIAYSIANPDPPSGTRALAAVRDTDGTVVSVDDEAIRSAQSALARRAGLCVEPASATALAGLRLLAHRGVVDRDDEVVLIATGTGFRELATDERTRDRVIDLDAVPVLLSELAGRVDRESPDQT